MTIRFFSCMAGAALLLACDDATAPKGTINYEFGRVTALIDERPWRSSFFPDSVVAFYDTVTARFQVSGQEVRSGTWPTMTVSVPANATVGAVGLSATLGQPVGTWIPALQQGYISSGVAGDSLWIEQFDPTTHTVRGAFQFLGAPLLGQKSVYVVGRFEGHYLPVGSP